MAGGKWAAARGALGAALLAGLPASAYAEPAWNNPAREAAVAQLIDEAHESPPALRVLLRAMPKGGDLHNHLGGAIYAEDYLGWAAAKGWCVDASGLSVEPPPCPAERAIERESIPVQQVASYFERFPPLTNAGRGQYAMALYGVGRPEAQQVALEAWRGGSMNPLITSAIFARLVESEPGLELAGTAASAEAALDQLGTMPVEVVLLDPTDSE